MDGGEAGWEEVTGVDGITRIFGYVPPSLPPKDFFLSIGEAKAEGFAAIDSATWRGAALIVAGLWAICVAWAVRNLVLGPARGLRQSAAEHRQFTRIIRVRYLNPFALVATQSADDRRIVPSASRIRAMYSAPRKRGEEESCGSDPGNA